LLAFPCERADHLETRPGPYTKEATVTETPRITNDLAVPAEKHAIECPSWEACGIFFFPTLTFNPRYVRLINSHPTPEKHYKIDYTDIEYGLGEAYAGAGPVGEISIFHSHPFGVGQPSRDDIQAIEDFNKHMDGHPLWRPTARHMIFSLWDHTWWWYDLEAFGRVGWRWPGA
jgi:proteasome lid subunit RPN8/RPN11